MNQTKRQLLAKIAQLESALNTAYTDQAYGCLTRAGIETRADMRSIEHNAVIFLDLDNMHDSNARYGYTEVDRRIAESIKLSSDLIVGRWYSGDELIILCNAKDAYGIAERVAAQLVSNGLSATFGIAALDKLADSVNRASTLVQSAKNENRRGSINA